MFNAEGTDDVDELKLYLVIPSELTAEGLTRLFSNYTIENIYRPPPPKNFAIVGPFNSAEEAKRAFVEFDNQPPYNMKVRFARQKNRYNEKKNYQKHGSQSVVSESRNNRGKVPTQNRSRHSNQAGAQSDSSNGPLDNSILHSVDAKNLYERAYMLLARENFAQFKRESWFKTFLKNMVYTYMSNVTNPAHAFQEIFKAFKASEEDTASNRSGEQASGQVQNSVIERLFIAETCKVGTKILLTINSSGSEGNICSILVDGSEQYQSLLDSFSQVCEKLPAVADTGSLAAGNGQIMAVKLASDNNWYRAVALHQTWALVDDGRVVPLPQVLKTVVCPKPHAEYPFYSCLLTHGVKNIKDWETGFEVEVLSAVDKQNRTIDVNLSSIEYGRSFSGKLHPWIASITAAGPPVDRTPKTPKLRKSVIENCSVNEKLSMSVISTMGKGLVCITNNENTTHQYSSLMEEFNQVCEKKHPLAGDLTRSGDLMAVKLKKSRDEEEGWFRAVPHEQGWALADEGFVVTPSDVQKTVTCPVSYNDIPFFSCLFTHDLKNFKGFPTNYTVKILKKDTATRTLDLELSNDEEGYKFNGYAQPWIPAIGGCPPLTGPLDPSAKGCKARTPVRGVPSIAKVPAPPAVARVPAPAPVVRVPAPATVARVPAPATVARVPAPATVARVPAPATVARVPAPATTARVPAQVTSPVQTAPTKASPSTKERSFTAVSNTKMLADVLNVGELVKILAQSKDSTGLRCLILHKDYEQKYELLCSDEFGSDCEKQPLAMPRSGALMAIKIADKGDAWFRAKWQNSLWLLMDDGSTSSRDQVKRIVDCPQAYVNIPFLSCHLTPDDMKSIAQEETNYEAIITRKEEAKNLVFVRVTGEKSKFVGLMQPLTDASDLQEILPETRPTANNLLTSVPVKNTKVDPVSKVMPNSKAAVTPKGNKMLADVLNVGELVKILAQSKDSTGLRCLILHKDYEQKYELLCSDEFGSDCEKQPLAMLRSGALMAVKIADKGDAWFRAKWQNSLWLLMDDGSTSSRDQVKRIVDCPQAYVNIPFLSCHLTPDDMKSIAQEETNYEAIITRKEEAKNLVFVRVTGKKSEFVGLMQPLTDAPDLQEIPPGTGPTVNNPQTSVPVKNTKVDPVSKVMPTSKAAVTPKGMRCMAETCKVKDEITLLAVTAERPGVLRCLHIAPDPGSLFESLFGEFATACEGEAPLPRTGDLQGLVAVELANTKSDGWYRAVPLHQKWALPDDGRLVEKTHVKQIVRCPTSFVDIPFFCYLLIHNNTIPATSYKATVISKNETTRTFEVTVYSDGTQEMFNGKLQPWIPTIEQFQQPKGNAASLEVSTSKAPKLSYGERYCSAENCEVGDEMRFTILQGKCNSYWQVCLTVSSRNEHHHRLMQKEFVSACELACQAGSGEQGDPQGLMAVMVWRDAMWHRALATPREGWALVDSGTIVPCKSVKQSLPCPEAFADIPFLCCQVRGHIPLSYDAVYSFKVISKNVLNRSLAVEILDEKNKKHSGTLKPWVPFALCRSTVAHRLSTVDLKAEKLNNNNLQPVFYDHLSKLIVSVGTRVLMVKFIDFAHVYLQLADSESKSEVVEHREKIAAYGLQSQPLNCIPLEGQIVLAPAYDMYNRAMVNDIEGDKCSVFFLDTGDSESVKVQELRMSPGWVGQVPPLLCISLAQLSTLRYNPACFSAIKKFISNKTVFKCKEITKSEMHLVVEQSMMDLNKMLLDLCTPVWKKLIQQGQSLYNLPVANYEEIKYVELRANQKVRILDSAMIIIGAVPCMPDSPLLDSKLDDLTKELEEYCSNMTDPYLPRQYEVCLYKNEAGKWYRAYVLEVRGDEMDLHSIDDGRFIKHINFSNVRKMPVEYLDYHPALSSLCTLQDFPSNPSDELIERAKEIIDTNRVFTINTVKKNCEGTYDISIKSLRDALHKEGLW